MRKPYGIFAVAVLLTALLPGASMGALEPRPVEVEKVVLPTGTCEVTLLDMSMQKLDIIDDDVMVMKVMLNDGVYKGETEDAIVAEYADFYDDKENSVSCEEFFNLYQGRKVCIDFMDVEEHYVIIRCRGAD